MSSLDVIKKDLIEFGLGKLTSSFKRLGTWSKNRNSNIGNFQVLAGRIWVPLSSTQTPSIQHIGSTQGPHLFSTQNLYPSVPHRPPQLNTSVSHKDHTFSAPKIPQFNTKPPQFLVWNWGAQVQLFETLFGLQ